MRRLTQKRLNSYRLCNRQVTKDSEGVPLVSYGDPVAIKGEVWPAKSTRQVAQYGDRISGIQNMRIEGPYSVQVIDGVERINFTDLGFTLSLGDGVQVYAEDGPDYQVLSFTQYEPLLMEIERL